VAELYEIRAELDKIVLKMVRAAGPLNLPRKSPNIGARDHKATISVSYPCQPII